MNKVKMDNAIVYCEGAFNTPNGKTAHGLVRFTRRYRILSVIDSRYEGKDTGQVLDGKVNGIPLIKDLDIAINNARSKGEKSSHFVIGLAPDGGRLNPSALEEIKKAIRYGLNVDCGLHDYLSDDAEVVQLADEFQIKLRDIRKPPPRNQLHFFTGKIEEVSCLKVAVLGTDSAIGKRTTAWILVQALEKAGYKAEIIGTGQTAWMQGAHYSIILDSLINDFVSGEIEHAVWAAWKDQKPDVIVIEGQGSLMNPAYPGGFEILAAGRPDLVVLQHAPARKEYDGFPGYPIQLLSHQIQAIELISGKKVCAVTINHENMNLEEIRNACQEIEAQQNIPAVDVLLEGADKLINLFKPKLKQRPLPRRIFDKITTQLRKGPI
jgi:uncharacterized NAD-dependent epimerase/dehydratase family protein